MDDEEKKKQIFDALAPLVGDVIREGKGLELFVSLGVHLAMDEGATDARVLDRVRKEALSSLSERKS